MLLKKTFQYHFLSVFWNSSVQARLPGFEFWAVGELLCGPGHVPQPFLLHLFLSKGSNVLYLSPRMIVRIKMHNMHSHCIISPQKPTIMVIKSGFLSYKDVGNTSEIDFIAIKVSSY